MNTIILWIGVALLVIGAIGLIASWQVGWMWVLAVLGVIGIVWGWLAGGGQQHTKVA